MATILNLFDRRRRDRAPAGDMAALLQGWSIEVLPRTAAKIERFADLLPEGCRVYVAHVDGTPIDAMVETAKRIAAEGFPVMPHVPARSVPSRAALAEWLGRYRDEAGVDQALAIAGGRPEPVGAFSDSMQLLDTGLFEASGFRRIHVAGHPEGARQIDPDGGDAAAMAALRWKQDWAEAAGVEMAVATQFCFEAAPVVDWARRLRAAGVRLPVHIGVAGPARLQTLIKYAMLCGVGPSLKVLQKRAADISRLMLPFTPEEVLRDLAAEKARDPALQIERVHFFPLGGVPQTAEFCDAAGRPVGGVAARA
ncbi:MAG: methylenetetrahydrofolate reductase [Rhodobacteraceae bacterium]|nr:MAG: methylenetetrahydrofolate reductase [Paracoccaceae bacterium]